MDREHPLYALCLMMAVLILTACAMQYEKGKYTGAVACVDITGPGFSWKCVEQSKTPTLPDGQYIPEAKP